VSARTTTLFVHGIYYREFETIRLGVYIEYVNSFSRSYCILDSKMVWSREAYLSEGRLAAIDVHDFDCS
jgi:hypothetical protein